MTSVSTVKVRVIHLLKATGIAGAEAHLLALLPALQAYGVDSELLLMEDPRKPQMELRRRMEAGGIPVTTVPIRWHLDPALPRRLNDLLKTRTFDVLHAHLPHAEFYGERAMRQYLRTPFVISRHNDDRFWRWLPVRLAFAASLQRAALVIAISQAVGRFLEQVEGVSQAKVACIPYGLDAREYAARAVHGLLRKELGIGDRPLVLFVGRMTAQKGVDVLLDAFAGLERRIPQAFLALAGDGPLRKKLEHLAIKRGIQNIGFLGWRADIPNLIADADLLAMPSRWEGFGLTALEAMALDKPVVAARVSALPEIVIDGETGLLVPPDDPGALADSICRLVLEPSLAEQYGRAGRTRVKQEFTVEKMAGSTAKEYRRLLKV